MKYFILNLIICKVCPIVLNQFNKINKFKAGHIQDFNIYNYEAIKETNECLKSELNRIKAGAIRYDPDNIKSIITSLEQIQDEENTMFDQEKVNEFLKFLKDPNTQNLLYEGDTNTFNKYNDIIDKLNTDSLNSEGYVPVTIFKELINSEIGNKLLKIFMGKTPTEISGMLYKTEDFVNNGSTLDLDDNSFGFRKTDVVLLTVLECLDAIRSTNNKAVTCCPDPLSFTININTPITDLKVNNTDIDEL